MAKSNSDKALPKPGPKEKVNKNHKDPSKSKDPLKLPGQKSEGNVDRMTDT